MSRPKSPGEAFFLRCWDAAREGRDVEGSDVHDWAEELGLLKRVAVTESCGEGCACDEVTGGDFPTDCYRPVPQVEKRCECGPPEFVNEPHEPACPRA